MLKKFLIGTLAVMAVFIATTAFAADFGTTTLRVGSKGEAVKAVQTLVGASVDGSFGPMTAAKVKVWQAANGLTADGVFGNMSKAKANGAVSGNFPVGCTSATGFSSTTGQACVAIPSTVAGCASGALFSATTGASCTGTTVVTLPAGCVSGALFSATTGASCTSTTTTVVTGGAGDLSITATTADVENTAPESITTKILGFKTEATGSDISISNIKVTLENTTAHSTSTRLDHYATEVSVYMGGTKIGSALVSNFTKDGTLYTATIPVNAVVRVGNANKVNFYVAVTPVGSMDSADATGGDGTDNHWTAKVASIRYADGTGLTLSQDPTTKATEIFTFTKITNSGDLKLTVAESSNPVAGNIMISDTSSTSDILLNKFTMKVEGADMTLTTLPIILTGAGTGTGLGLSGIAQNLILKADGVQVAEIDSIVSPTPTGSVVQTSAANANNFVLDNDLVMKAGSTVTFTIYAKVNKIAATGTFIQGDSLLASVTGNTAVVETTGTGSSFTSKITGASNGNAQTFRSTGIAPTLVSTSVTVAKGLAEKSDLGTYSITFDVTAFGADMYIDKAAPLKASGFVNQLAVAGDAASTLTAVITSSTATEKTNSFFVPQGTTQRFTITAVVTPSVGGLSALKLTGISYATSNISGNLMYNSNLISYVTQYQNLVLSN